MVGKIIKKFPFDDPVLMSIGFINPLFKTKFQSDCGMYIVLKLCWDLLCLFFHHALLFHVQSITVLLLLIVVTQLVNRFPGVLKQEEVDLLEDQYTDYLLASKEDLPLLKKILTGFGMKCSLWLTFALRNQDLTY